MKSIRTLILATIVFHVACFAGGDRSSPRGSGMARTLNGLSRGIDALGVNPANLAFRDVTTGAITFFPVGVQVSSDLIPYDIYQEYFTGVPGPDGVRRARYLTDFEKEKIISEMKKGLGTTRLDLEMTLIALSFQVSGVGGFGLSVTEHIGGKLVLPSDYFRFYFFGLDSAGSHYSFDGSEISGWWWREFNISFGREIPLSLFKLKSLHAGVGLKLVQGFGVIETDHYRASLANALVGQSQYRADLSFDYLMRRSGVDFLDEKKGGLLFPFPQPAGTGFGLDLGVAAELPGMTVHLAVSDIGVISWTKNIVETYGDYNRSVDDPLTQANKDTIEHTVRGLNRPGAEFSTALPTKLRIGIVADGRTLSWMQQIPGDLLLAFDYTQGLNNSLGNTTRPRFSIGAEYRIIPLIPLRTGLSIGGGDKLRWAAGIGLDLHSVSLDVATENIGILFFPNDITMISLAAGLKIRL